MLATAVIRIGPQATAGPVPFELVRRAPCVPAKPACPAAGGIPGYERSGEYGILGIGTQSGRSPVVSPILGMQGRLGRTWSIHVHGRTGALVLGAALPSGLRVTVTLPGAPKPFWTFTSGTTKSSDTVTVRPDANPFVNAGVPSFYAFSITYDDAFGTLTLVPAR